MKRIKMLMMMALLAGNLTTEAQSAKSYIVTDTIFNRYEHEAFAFGADVSFVPMMEGWGTKWLDKRGRQRDILLILKDQGINNIRLRVWTVNSGASSKQEVVSMCKRAKSRGMGVMIDFHYSDTWADPGNQTIPSAWTNHSVEALEKLVYDHTYDVLSAIKAAGVTPKWVQVGNETKRGMLYPVGQTNKGGSVAFARFVRSGYDAVKAVDSTMQVIVHLPDGHDNSLYRGIFDGLKKNGAKWDIIGLSAYPRWSHLDGPTMITKVMANINDLKKRYGTPCMVVETGHYPNKAIEGNQYLVGVMNRMIKNGDLGCFYWEPESMGGYDMGAWNESTRKPTEMMDAFLGIKHTTVSWLMKAQIKSPMAGETIIPGDLQIKADVQHIRKDRIRSAAFYVDNRLEGDVKATPYQWTISDVPIGVHTVWTKVTDTATNTLQSDTVTFFVGESAIMNDADVTDGDQRGGTARWGVNFNSTGKYRLVFRYSSPSYRSTEVRLNGDSITKIPFLKHADAYQTFDIDVAQSGYHELLLTATYTSGLPDIKLLRIFPLNGQPLPEASVETAVTSVSDTPDGQVAVYSLSGMFMGTVPQSRLDISLGNRSSALIVMPVSSPLLDNCVGGRPYIVRKVMKRNKSHNQQ